MARQFDSPYSFLVNPSQIPVRTERHRSSLEHDFNLTLASPPCRPEWVEGRVLYLKIFNDCESFSRPEPGQSLFLSE